MTTVDFTPAPKFTAIGSNGDPWEGAKLYTYETGTTTPKTTWTDASKATENTNPIILDQYGQANVWIDSSDGNYTLTLTDPDDVMIWSVDEVSDPGADVESRIETALTVLDPRDTDYDSLTAALKALDGVDSMLYATQDDTLSEDLSTGYDLTGVTLVIQPGVTVTTDTEAQTFQFNVRVEDGGQLLLDENVTAEGNLESKGNTSGVVAFDAVGGGEVLTINGKGTIAGRWKVFGSGLSFAGDSKIDEVYPEWFGANSDDGSTDNATPFEKAANFISNVTIKCSKGTYYFSTGFKAENPVVIKGLGNTRRGANSELATNFRFEGAITTDVQKYENTDDDVAGIWIRGADNGSDFSERLFFCRIEDIFIQYNHTSGTAVMIDDCVWSKVQNTNINSAGDHAIRTVNNSWEPVILNSYLRTTKAGSNSFSENNPNDVRTVSFEHNGSGGCIDHLCKITQKGNATGVFILGSRQLLINEADINTRDGGVGVHFYTGDYRKPNILQNTLFELNNGGTAVVVEGEDSSNRIGAYVSTCGMSGGDGTVGSDPMVKLINTRNANFNNCDIAYHQNGNRVEIDSDSVRNIFWECIGVSRNDSRVVDNGSDNLISRSFEGLTEFKEMTTENPRVLKNFTDIDVGTGGSYGSAITVTPADIYNNGGVEYNGIDLRMPAIDVSNIDTGSSEEITVQFEVVFSDGSSTGGCSIKTTTDGNIQAADNRNLAFLYQNSSGGYITSVNIAARTNLSSTSVTVDARLYCVMS